MVHARKWCGGIPKDRPAKSNPLDHMVREPPGHRFVGRAMEVGQMSGDTAGVRHDPERRRFEIESEAGTAVLTYGLDGETVVFTHTLVPKALEGQGIGSRMVRAGLDWARANGLKVVPQCPFVAAYIERHPEERELLA
jgi:hypothetical protein